MVTAVLWINLDWYYGVNFTHAFIAITVISVKKEWKNNLQNNKYSCFYLNQANMVKEVTFMANKNNRNNNDNSNNNQKNQTEFGEGFNFDNLNDTNQNESNKNKNKNKNNDDRNKQNNYNQL